jgi:hypothetical protein
MNLRALALFGLTAGVVLSGASQAQAMNLLVAVGNPQIEIVVAQDGSLRVLQTSEERMIEVSNVEPAAGVQTVTTEIK